MKTAKKFAIGCLSAPFILVLLIWIICWAGAFDHGFSEYRNNCKRISTYLKSPTTTMRYEGELRRILTLHKYPHVVHRGDVIFSHLIPFDSFFQMMGHKLAVLMLGTPEDIEEKIYQAAKEAMDSGNYIFASRFFMVLSEFDYKDSRELMVQSRSKNRKGLGKSVFLNLGMRKWDSEGHLAPMAWKVVDRVEGKLLLEAQRPVEMHVLDDRLCGWLNGEMFNGIFFDGSGSAVVPLDDSTLSLVTRNQMVFDEKVYDHGPQGNNVSKLFCQELGNKIFLINPDRYTYMGDFAFDGVEVPYLVDRKKIVEDSTGIDCCRNNAFPFSPENFMDSVIAVVPSIFVDTLLLKQY
jgi:hypothetical protein